MCCTLSKCSNTRYNFFSATTTSRSFTTARWLSSLSTAISLNMHLIVKMLTCSVCTWWLWMAPLHFHFPNESVSMPRSALSLCPSPKKGQQLYWHNRPPHPPCKRRHTFPHQSCPVSCNSPSHLPGWNNTSLKSQTALTVISSCFFEEEIFEPTRLPPYQKLGFGQKNTVGDLDIGYKLKTIEKQQMRIVFMQSIHTSKYCLTEDLDLKTQMKSNFGFSMNFQ